jgi:hypothetical protein
MLIAVMGQYREIRFTHVSTLAIRLSNDGGNQPRFLLWRLLNLGFR